MAMHRAIPAIVLALACHAGVALADDNDTYGSFGAQVTDGSSLKQYNRFLDKLFESATWASVGSVRQGAPNDNFAMYSALSGVFAGIVKESGGADIPPYASDALNLKTIGGFRAYARQATQNPAFVADDTSCGAAVTFVYPAGIAALLIVARPVYATGYVPTREEINSMGVGINQQVTQDAEYLKKLCANRKDQQVVQGYYNFYNMLNADLPSTLASVDKDYNARNYPFVATLTCGMGGQNMNVIACFKSTDLKITTDNQGKLYKMFNLGDAGAIDKQGLHINLPEHFATEAQNSQQTLILGLTIKDRAGKVVYADQQGQYGVISVKH